MKKINTGKNVFIYPMPVVLVGTRVGDKVNFMTVGWVTRVNAIPPMVAVAINNVHHTPSGILENKTFSINFPGTGMVDMADYCGIVSGKKTDKSELFEVFYGETGTAPMITDCPLNMECRLFQTVALPSNHLFIGEIIATYSEEKYMTEGKLDVKKIDPMVLTMPDNSYWKIGEYVGKAWSAGKKIRDGR